MEFKIPLKGDLDEFVNEKAVLFEFAKDKEPTLIMFSAMDYRAIRLTQRNTLPAKQQRTYKLEWIQGLKVKRSTSCLDGIMYMY